MKTASLFMRACSRLHRQEGGFGLVETMMALGIIFVTLLGLAYTSTIAFTDVAFARQRQAANNVATRVLEQTRGLSYAEVTKGLSTSDLTGDPNIVACPDGAYYLKTCDATAERIVHTAGLPTTPPLVPHVGTFGPPTYPVSYTRSVYVTQAKDVPAAGALRVTVIVTWTGSSRTGASRTIESQTLVHQPEGTTGSETGGSTGGGAAAPFFYGTASQSRGFVRVTPNAGVSGGTGVSGLPSWDSMSQELYGLDANIQQQALTKADAQVAASGARKVAGGNETVSGGISSNSTADDDPATTTIGGSDAPAAVSQTAVSANVTGGGNKLEVVAASGTPCPTRQPSPWSATNYFWMTGMEHGSTSGGGAANSIFGAGNNVTGLTASTEAARNGTYGLKLVASNLAVGRYNIGFQTSASVLHFAIRFPSVPAADVPELAWVGRPGSAYQKMVLGYQASSQRFMARVRNATGTWSAWQVATMNPIASNQWYSIDMRYDSSNTSAWRGDWRVDGVAQTQVTVAATASDNLTYNFGIGSSELAITVTAHFDDMVYSQVAADYPIDDMRILPLFPDGMEANNGNPGTAMGVSTGTVSTAWQLLDDIPFTSTADYVRQTANSGTNYIGITFQNPPESCIRGVYAWWTFNNLNVNQANNGKASVFDGTTESNRYIPPAAGDMTATTAGNSVLGFGVTPASGGLWTQSGVNGLVGRVGYSTDSSPNPRWDSFMLEYGSPVSGGLGPAGTETVSSASTISATGSPACGNPTQIDGRPCAYAREDYSTAGPPYLQTAIDLTGSGAGTCVLFKRTPATAGGSTSYAHGRRTAGTGGDGTVRESLVRFNGTNEFGQLCSGTGTAPANWAGYLVRYDATSTSTCAHAEAGIGSAAPQICSAGTISYWNGTSLTSITPPLSGGSIPIPAFTHSTGIWRYDVTASLSTAPSFTSQVPSTVVGTANRTEARARLGSPLVGTITYKLTNTSTAQVVVDLSMTVDLGSLTAFARYQAGS